MPKRVLGNYSLIFVLIDKDFPFTESSSGLIYKMYAVRSQFIAIRFGFLLFQLNFIAIFELVC